MRLLLHVCCAPCSTGVIRRLRGEYDLALVFENPNIQPETEYALRLAELERYAAAERLPVLPARYDPERWNRAVAGLEEEPEGGRRCEICFRLRLRAVAEQAAAGGFDLFTTTLTVAPLKNAGLVNRVAGEEGARAGVRALAADFKKRDGFKESCRLSREAGLYRQDYCGCLPSRRARERRRGEPSSRPAVTSD